MKNRKNAEKTQPEESEPGKKAKNAKNTQSEESKSNKNKKCINTHKVINIKSENKGGNIMDTMFTVRDGCLLVTMPKEMDHYKVDMIRKSIDQYLLSGEAQSVVLDFENTGFMDSSGIGLIVGRHKMVSCFGGKLVATHANPRIQKILLMSGVKDMIEII